MVEARKSEVVEKISVFPTFFKVENQRIIVFGNGEEALAKLRLLSMSNANIISVADAPKAVLHKWLQDNAIEHQAIIFHHDILTNAKLVFAATGDKNLDLTIAKAAKEKNIPVNVVDRPHLCDFYTPAIVNRAPIVVAIGSEGTGPVLVQIIRAKIDALLNPSLGHLAKFAQKFRQPAEKIAKGASRRVFWRAFFSGNVAKAIENGDEDLATKAGYALLAKSNKAKGHINLLAVAADDVENLTLRAQRALMEADVILYDENISPAFLNMARRDAVFTSITKNENAAWQAHRLAAKNLQIVRLYHFEHDMADEIIVLSEAVADFEILPSLKKTRNSKLPHKNPAHKKHLAKQAA